MSSIPRMKTASPKLLAGVAMAAAVFGLLIEPALARPSSAADGLAGWSDAGSGLHQGRKVRKAKGKHKAKKAKDESTLAVRTKGKAHKGRRRRHNKAKVEEFASTGGLGEPTCQESLAKAKELVQQTQLVEAREVVEKCARPSCGKVVEEACTAMQTELQTDTPTVVVTADSGSPANKDLEVTMDGKPLTSKLDGRAIPVNPGNHEFAFSSEGSELGTQTLLIVQGQRNRSLTVPSARGGKKKPAVESLAAKTDKTDSEEGADGARSSDAAAADDGESESRSRKSHESASSGGGSSWATWALAGVGVAGLGGAALLTYWGRKDNADLASMCAPDCSAGSVHHIRNLYLAADIAAGAGVVALIASTWLAVTSNGESEHVGRKEVAHIRRLDLRPTASGGAIASIGGSF